MNTAPMKWEVYREDYIYARYVIHVEVDAGPFVFHRYGIIEELALYKHEPEEVFKTAIKTMTEEITATVHRIRGTVGNAIDDHFLNGH